MKRGITEQKGEREENARPCSQLANHGSAIKQHYICTEREFLIAEKIHLSSSDELPVAFQHPALFPAK